jgi:uncharacterized protein (DUF4415 family)
VVLGGFAGEGSDACACCSADDGAFEASAEDCAEDCSACCSDGCAFAGADAALLVVAVVVAWAVVIVGAAVVAAAASAVADSVVVAGGNAVVVAVIAVLREPGEGGEEKGWSEDEAELALHGNSFRLRSWMLEWRVAEDRMWKNAVRGRFYRPVKQAVSLRLDADVIAWLKKDGQGYQTRANQILGERMLKELEGR